MTGVELLQQAMVLYPDAKRVLLTAYADTEAAIRAINSAKIHYYLNKPWDPPEEKLYPVLDDLLEAWKQGYKPPYEGIQGNRDAVVSDGPCGAGLSFAESHPVSMAEPGAVPRGDRVVEGERASTTPSCRSCCLATERHWYSLQRRSSQPKSVLRTEAKQEFYDVVVIGAGPAGLAAGVYGASEGSADADRGGRGPGWPGGIELAHRKLPRLPCRLERRGAGQACVSCRRSDWVRSF